MRLDPTVYHRLRRTTFLLLSKKFFAIKYCLLHHKHHYTVGIYQLFCEYVYGVVYCPLNVSVPYLINFHGVQQYNCIVGTHRQLYIHMYISHLFILSQFETLKFTVQLLSIITSSNFWLVGVLFYCTTGIGYNIHNYTHHLI